MEKKENHCHHLNAKSNWNKRAQKNTKPTHRKKNQSSLQLITFNTTVTNQ